MSYLKNNVIACFVFCFVSNQIHADMGCENNRSFYNGKSGSIWLYKKNNQKYDLLVAVSSSRLEKLSKLIKSKSIIDLSLDMLSFDLLDKGNDKVYLIRFSGTGKDKPVTGRTKLKDILASKSETIKPVEIFKVDSDNFYLPSKIVWPTIFKDSHNLEDFDNPFIFGNINDLETQ